MNQQIIVQYEKETGASFRDGLTGLFNHGFFQISLDLELKRFTRHNESFTLGLIDVDSFYEYNKQNGHAKADRVLKEVADLIRNNIREVDLAARYSGDVFSVIFSGSDARSASLAAERIRKSIYDRFRGIPTVSIGLVSFPEHERRKEGLIKKAAEALMQAKLGGKNRVHFFETGEDINETDKPKVLLVDDDPRNVKLLEAYLLPLDYEIVKAYSGKEALDVTEKTEVDLILLDLMMPGMDGYEVCRRLKSLESTRMIPIILITALDDGDAKVRGIEAGADDFITKPPNKEELLARTKSLIKVRKLNKNLTSIESVLFSLASAVEAKDSYTEGHTKRVANLAVTLGKNIGLTDQEINALKLGGILHDVGKIGVPGRILNKPGPLDEEEWQAMMNHTELGYRICLPLMKTLGPALDVVRHHHEKLSGDGYPDRIKGDEISMPARVMAVVDIYDALITNRPYRKAMNKEKALEILHEEAEMGKIDKKVVNALSELVVKRTIEKKEAESLENGDQD